MKTQTPFSRFLMGFLALLVVLAAGFYAVGAAIPTLGASAEEIRMSLPGDDIVGQPQIVWNHAITIHAAPEKIYPWLIQMGDTRAAYYSYTFIENVFMLASKSSGRYVNADTVHPEWQTPPIGQGMIDVYLKLAGYKANQYVLAAASPDLPGMSWSWLWYLQPVDAQTTRLIVRHRIGVSAELPLNVMTAVFDAGYVMERGMLLGIRDRAEGHTQAGTEPLGIALWLTALVCGLADAVRYVRKPGVSLMLALGLAAVAVLFWFTFVQPPLWARAVVDAMMIGATSAGIIKRKRVEKDRK